MARDWGTKFAVREGRIGRVLIAFMAAGFVGLIAAIAAAALVNNRSDQRMAAVVHTYRVELAIADLRRLIEQGETTRRGYLLSPSTPGFRTAYREAAEQLPVRFADLQALVNDNPRQRAAIASLGSQFAALVALREDSVDLVSRGAVAEARRRFDAELGAARLRAIRATFDAMTREERRLLAIRNAAQQASVRLFYIVLAATSLLLMLVAISALLVVLRYTRDLGASRDELRSLNENLELAVAERTADLTRANDEIQRFAYIVSHDLRSPLVNVMGFTAELEGATGALATLVDRAEAEAPAILDDDARLAAREDLPEAIGFIRSSTQKMDRLINAILALSRQGRRVLTPEPLDLAGIVGGIRDTLAHRLDEEGARIDIDSALPAIVNDRLAIEQILSNLIENAVKYRHPDRPVVVTVTGGSDKGAAGQRAWIAVADNGRGIEGRDHERVFDLFRRSGTQDRPGEGIGLAHVRALAYRLGGVIDLTSTLGQGSTFRLSLPSELEIQEKSA